MKKGAKFETICSLSREKMFKLFSKMTKIFSLSILETTSYLFNFSMLSEDVKIKKSICLFFTVY